MLYTVEIDILNSRSILSKLFYFTVQRSVSEQLRKEELINCTCGFMEEDGLMIQVHKSLFPSDKKLIKIFFFEILFLS